MGIDKIKKKKKPNQLVSKRKDGKRPGYYGSDDYGYGEAGTDSTAAGSSDSGGEDNYTPADYGFVVSQAPTPEPDTSGDDQEDDVAQVMVDMGLTPDNSPTDFTLPDAEDDGDTGESLYVSPTQITKENQPYVNYTPGPNAVTAAQLAAFNQNTGTSDNMFSLTENKIRATNPIEEPKKGILSTLGNFAKNAAINIGGTMAFGPSFPKMRSAYKTAQFIDDRFLNDKIPGISFAKGTGGKPPTGTGFDNDNDGNNSIIAKNVVASNVQKYSPEYINRAIDLRDRLQPVQDRLNEKGQMTLASLNKLIEQYQV
jgi:hypothetical protein